MSKKPAALAVNETRAASHCRCDAIRPGTGVMLDNAWSSVFLSFSPLLAIAVLYAEISAFCAARQWRLAQLLLSTAIFCALVLFQYATQPNSYAMQTRPVAYFLVVVWVTAAPIAVLAVGAHLLVKARAAMLRHAGLAALSVAVLTAHPYFALFSLCASGVDCV